MGVRLTSHWTAAAFTGLLFVPGREWMKLVNGWMNEWRGWVKELFFLIFGNCGAHGGIILTRENRRTRRRTCPSATLSTTNPTGLTRARTRAAAVRGRRLTAWAMVRPSSFLKYGVMKFFINYENLINNCLMHCNKLKLNYSYLLLKSYSKKKKFWHHKSFLLF
jgi:hypothetical protein